MSALAQNPVGFQPNNDYGKRVRYVTNAIKRAVHQDDGKKLRSMVDKMMDLAIDGDVSAAVFIRDSLDGKPVASVEIQDDRSTLREYTVAQLMQIIAEQASQGKQSLTIDQVSEQTGVGECTGVAVDGGVGTAGVECSNSTTKTV